MICFMVVRQDIGLVITLEKEAYLMCNAFLIKADKVPGVNYLLISIIMKELFSICIECLILS